MSKLLENFKDADIEWIAYALDSSIDRAERRNMLLSPMARAANQQLIDNYKEERKELLAGLSITDINWNNVRTIQSMFSPANPEAAAKVEMWNNAITLAALIG